MGVIRIRRLKEVIESYFAVTRAILKKKELLFNFHLVVEILSGGSNEVLYMVVEYFKNRNAPAVYERVRQRGRMMPDGLKYIDSWVDRNFNKCFQLMECDNPDLLDEWVSKWRDLVDFEIVQVITSKQAAARINADV